MKYIDADKLIAEIERRLKDYWEISFHDVKTYCEDSNVRELKELLTFIASLQQPKVDLEKEMDKYYGVYRDKTGKTYDIEDDEPCFDWKEGEFSERDMRLARHFYELGLNTRKEE